MNYEEEIKKLQARVEELEKKSGGVNEPRWSFTEDEKTILRNVPEEYRWISRDGRDAVEYCRLHCWTKKPEKEKWLGGWDNPQDIQLNFMMFEHIFQCIKWEDNEPCEFRKFL